jgi:S-adenosylmethionine decarboxylase
MKQVGTHLILDAWGAPAELLDDRNQIKITLLEAVKVSQGTLIDFFIHQFNPHGITATATLAESHITIHTWPEYEYFAADLFFCGEGKPLDAIEIIKNSLQAQNVSLREINRGFPLEKQDK